MIISPFSPVFFIGPRKAYGRECPSLQFFAVGDSLRIQVIRTSDEISLDCKMKRIDDPGSPASIVAPNSTLVGGNYVDVYSIALSAEGVFTVTLGDNESEPFMVVSDQVMIEDSVLIEYSPADNSVRNDVVAMVGGQRQYFAIRFPGGFRADGFDFSVDNEQFTAQTSDIVELYSRESMQETLTVGWSRGVPIWFGQMLNRLLTCKYVYVDGLRYARYESSVPEKQQTLENVNGFIFRQKLQRINHIDPTKS